MRRRGGLCPLFAARDVGGPGAARLARILNRRRRPQAAAVFFGSGEYLSLHFRNRRAARHGLILRRMHRLYSRDDLIPQRLFLRIEIPVAAHRPD